MTTMATAPPLGLGQMIKIGAGEHKGETGFVVEQKKTKFRIQLLGGEGPDHIYLPPSHIKPMYLSDSPRVNPKLIEAPQDQLSISPSPSNVSSITSPTVNSQISAPDGSSFRKYKGGTIEPGHGVRIIGGTYKGLRGFVIEHHRVKLLVRLEHTEEEVFLMPSNLGPWERSAAHAVLKRRRGRRGDDKIELAKSPTSSTSTEKQQPPPQQQKQQQPTENPQPKSPMQKFWSPVKERGSLDDTTEMTKDSRSTSTGIDLVFSHTSDLGGVKIDLSAEDTSNDSSTERNDPSQQNTVHHANNHNQEVENSVSSRTRQHVVSPSRLGSPLRRRRLKVTSPERLKVTSPERHSDVSQHEKRQQQQQQQPVDIQSSPSAAGRSVFKRRAAAQQPHKEDSFRPISISTSSTVSSTDPSTVTTTEPSSAPSMNTADHLQAHKNRQSNRHQQQETKQKLHSPIATKARERDSDSHQSPLRPNTAVTRSIFKRKKSPSIRVQPIETSNVNPTITKKNAVPPKAATPKKMTSNTSTPKSSTPKTSTPKSAAGTPKSARSPRGSPSKSPRPSGIAEVVGMPRKAVQEKFTFKNVQKNQAATRHEAPTRTRGQQERGRYSTPTRSRNYNKEESPRAATTPESQSSAPSDAPPPAEMKRSLSPLMLRRRTMSRAKAEAVGSSPDQPKGSGVSRKSLSLSPLKERRRPGSRLKTAHALKGIGGDSNDDNNKYAEEKGKEVQAMKKLSETPKMGNKSKSKFETSKIIKKKNTPETKKVELLVDPNKQQLKPETPDIYSDINTSKRGENRTLMRQAIVKKRNERRRQKPHPDEDSTVSSGNQSESSDSLEQACSWSFSTTASTEALLRKYSEAMTRPMPAKTIRVVTTPVAEEDDESDEASPMQQQTATSPTVAAATFVPVIKETTANNVVKASGDVACPASKAQKNSHPPPKLVKTESNIEATPLPGNVDSYEEDPEEEEIIIAKYNRILQRRMNAIKQRQNAEETSVESSKQGNCYISDDEESDSFVEGQQTQEQQESALQAGRAAELNGKYAFSAYNIKKEQRASYLQKRRVEQGRGNSSVQLDENMQPISEPAHGSSTPQGKGRGTTSQDHLQSQFPTPPQATVGQSIPSSRQKSPSSLSSYAIALSSIDEAGETNNAENDTPPQASYDGALKTGSVSSTNARSSGPSTTRYAFEELSIDTSGSSSQDRESPIPEPPLSTKALQAQQEARRKSFEDQRKAAKQSAAHNIHGNGAAVYASPKFSRERPEAQKVVMEPQLFTQKLLAHTLDPPPPPPPPPIQPSPRNRSVFAQPPPPPPPITPRTPGGSRHGNFVELPVSPTPRNSSLHQNSPRHIFGEPSPRTPKTPNANPNIFTEPSPRASSPCMRSSSPIGSPVGRSSPVNARYGTSFGYGSDTVCDLVLENSQSPTTLDGEEIPPAPGSSLSREEQQRKNRTMFQKSFFKATHSRSSSNRKSSHQRDLAKQISALSKSAPSGSPLQEVMGSSPNSNRQGQLTATSRATSSPISIITKQSFSPQATHRSSVSKAKDHVLQQIYSSSPSKASSTAKSALKGTSKSGDKPKRKSSLGASWQEILQLPTRTLTRKDILNFGKPGARKSCILCQKSFRPKDVVRTLPCQHCFHTTCVDPYLFVQAQCPECKRPAVMLEL